MTDNLYKVGTAKKSVGGFSVVAEFDDGGHRTVKFAIFGKTPAVAAFDWNDALFQAQLEVVDAEVFIRLLQKAVEQSREMELPE